MLDRIATVIELLADLLVRSSDIMNYPVWLRRLILLTFPVTLPLLIIVCALGSCVVYLATLVMSVIYEVREEGFAYLFHAPSLTDLYRR